MKLRKPRAQARRGPGAYDAGGALVKQTMPGGVIQRTTYDDGGEPVERSYSGQVTRHTQVLSWPRLGLLLGWLAWGVWMTAA